MRNPTATKLLFEMSCAGRGTQVFPESDVPEVAGIPEIGAEFLATEPLPLPEIAEPDVVRHFVNLSTLNMSVDSHFYPLGSCTMKYNPKRHERWARLPQAAGSHPYQSEAQIQGLLSVLYELQGMLAEIAGLPGVSLHPAAGAQGEFTALLTAAAYFRDRGEQRTRVLFPASAHGTNPASAALAGFECVQLAGGRDGFVDLDELRAQLDERTAVFMVTNPNTLGLFERDIRQVSELLHSVGGLVYIDGANMNAILGRTRPGDFGGDMMHYNVHKTFTGPHGAGGRVQDRLRCGIFWRRTCPRRWSPGMRLAIGTRCRYRKNPLAKCVHFSATWGFCCGVIFISGLWEAVGCVKRPRTRC